MFKAQLNEVFSVNNYGFDVESNSCKTVSVMIRGDITKRIFDVWNYQIQLLSKELKLICELTPQTSVIVVHGDCAAEAFVQWGNIFYLPPHVQIVRKDWIINMISQSKVIETSQYAYQFPNNNISTPLPILSGTIEVDISKPKRSAKDFYACATSGTAAVMQRVNENSHITSILDELQSIYDLCGDEWRANGYKRCSASLQKLPKILDIKDIDNVFGIGKSIRDKIEEIISTGKLQKLDNFKSNTKIQSLTAITKIWGIGVKSANVLYNQGFRTIADIRERGMNLLTAQQLVGLNRYEDLQERIPRSEVEVIGDTVTRYANMLVPGVQCVVCGSFRRRKASSGDVDVLIGPPEGVEVVDILPQLVADLARVGFLTDHLTMPANSPSVPGGGAGVDNNINSEINNTKLSSVAAEESVRSYMGVCLVEKGGTHRRLDLKTYPRSLFAFALLYFTGSDHFNRSMRLYARREGYSLNDKGLVKCIRDAKRVKVASGPSRVCHSEQQIFDALGLPYKEPWDRNCFDFANVLGINDGEDEEDDEDDDDDLHGNRKIRDVGLVPQASAAATERAHKGSLITGMQQPPLAQLKGRSGQMSSHQGGAGSVKMEYAAKSGKLNIKNDLKKEEVYSDPAKLC